MKHLSIALLIIFVATAGSPARAHFGLVIPSNPIIAEPEQANVNLAIAFAHPFEGKGMDMKKPQKVLVSHNGETSDIASGLKPARFLDHDAWNGEYKITRPGVYQVGVIPEPYFEPAEDSFIIHYAKTALGAFGEEAGWDEPLGLPLEIVPLSRPFGNYAGNLFQGQVLRDGTPLPNAYVEVEYLNDEAQLAPDSGYAITQLLKTDDRGIFAYAIPWAGWWGFAALSEAPYKLNHNGEDKDVELGAVYWSRFAPRPAGSSN